METKDVRSLEEKRAYYRLLRHLLSERLRASYKEDEGRPLPPRIVDLLEKLETPVVRTSPQLSPPVKMK